MEHLNPDQRAAYGHFGILRARQPYYRIIIYVEEVTEDENGDIFCEDWEYPVGVAEFDNDEEAVNYANEIICAVPPEYAIDTP